jgi:type I restriction-modification system DNA methylase subunit
MPELLELTHENLGWPSKKDIMNPKGVGPNVLANLAKRKLKTAINQLDVEVEVGILAANPDSDKTEDPLAIVCEFNNEISQDKLRIVQRLAWSFSRSPMLITIEPALLRVWTCWKKPPEDEESLNKCLVQKCSVSDKSLLNDYSLSEQAAKSLQWIEFVSGNFFKKHSKYFQRNQRADQLMLEDLKCLRKKLLKEKLPQDICHDLIARIIFIEFLFQRKDSKGNAALNEGVLESLHENGILSKAHKDFVSILKNRKETYRFFRELNERFNGDLFPGKGKTPDEREAEWKAEMDEVKASHLNLLAEFVNGKLEISTGQYCLWRRYAFDVIPLEFISSIYEEFVTKEKKKKEEDGKAKEDTKNTGVHYTPGYLVDFILDEVLPWKSKKWNLKILDPACGSGIFLVKAYQRLVYRYQKAQGKPKIKNLRKLLENNLFGVDKDRNAVRVASFSLYLAMCDEIEPKLIWPKNVRFPPLRDKTIVESDFFAEDKKGFSTDKDNGTYDLVIGNAPWGYKSETEKAKLWARKDVKSSWPILNRNIGPLFLCKAAALTKKNGQIIMLQPTGPILFNKSKSAMKFRNKFFTQYKVEKIVNLSALRFGMFKNAVGPACILTMRSVRPNNDPLEYVCPKPSHTKEDQYRIIIEPYDINNVFPDEAKNIPYVWTALAWGGRRDLTLLHHLNNFDSIKTVENEKKKKFFFNGFKRRKGADHEELDSQNLPVLEENIIWDSCPIVSDINRFPKNKNLMFENLRELEIYELPLIILKETWKVDYGRFKAILVKQNKSHQNRLLYSRSFYGIHAWDKNIESSLAAFTMALNSILAVYYFMLSGARMGNYRPSLLLKDIKEFPLPQKTEVNFKILAEMSRDAIDAKTQNIYLLKDAEWILIDDLFKYTLQDFMGGIESPGRQQTQKNGNEDVLNEYCRSFRRVLKAGFGEDKNISATIFTEGEDSSLPVRLVAIHLGSPEDARINVEPNCPDLLDKLKELDAKYLDSEDKRKGGGIFYRRVARIYDTVKIAGLKVPTIYLVKPDKVRYWTRSMALRDADEVAADIMLWKNEVLNNTQMQRGKIWLKKLHSRKDAGRIQQNLHHS